MGHPRDAKRTHAFGGGLGRRIPNKKSHIHLAQRVGACWMAPSPHPQKKGAKGFAFGALAGKDLLIPAVLLAEALSLLLAFCRVCVCVCVRCARWSKLASHASFRRLFERKI